MGALGRRCLKLPAFQPYWGKPAVRNDRGDSGNVGIIRSPLRATVLPDCGGRSVMVVPTATVIRVRRPIVRNRDCLSPLACVVGLPDNENQVSDYRFTRH